MIDFVRTPASRFRGIPDYPFEPRYFEVDGLRMHYVDEGPRSASPVLLLHGEPSWSFLYRHMIAKLVAKGHRTIAPPMSSADPATAQNLAAWEVLERWSKPFLTIYSNGDPVLGDMDALFQARVPGAMGQPHARVEGGHFLQEAAAPELARRIHELIVTDRTPL